MSGPVELRDVHQAAACRELFAAVVLTALNDYRFRALKARGCPYALGKLRAEVERYFGSSDGKHVLLWAGLDPDACPPALMADRALDTRALSPHARPDSKRKT